MRMSRLQLTAQNSSALTIVESDRAPIFKGNSKMLSPPFNGASEGLLYQYEINLLIILARGTVVAVSCKSAAVSACVSA
jgi:hypothetical protein